MTTLYHYCSASTLFSIIEHKSIWLSSLTLSNDYMEGRIVSSILEKMFNTDKSDSKALEHLREATSFYENAIDGLGFCLSEDGDLLSQWRGYANDGHGFAIGFSREYLESIAKPSNKNDVMLRKVIYDNAEQEIAVKPVYDKLKEIIASGKLNYPHKWMGLLGMETDEEYEKRVQAWTNARTIFYNALIPIIPQIFALKNTAFIEEREYRLISLLIKNDNLDCSFRISGDKLIPYRKFELPSNGINQLIEIVTGPKCVTPNYVLKGFLNKNGFSDIPIIPSRATYR